MGLAFAYMRCGERKTLRRFVCLDGNACGAKDASPAEDTAPEVEAAQPDPVPEPEPDEPEPEPEPEIPVAYADTNQIHFEETGEIAFQGRDADDTQDIAYQATVSSTSSSTPDGANQFFVSVTFSHAIPGDENNAASLENLNGYRGNVYLFDVYTGAAIPTPAEREGIGPVFDRYEQCEWEQTVTVDGTEYPLSMKLESHPYYTVDMYWFTVTAPAGYDRLGLIVTSSSVDVTEPIDISNYIAEGDNVCYFQATAAQK